jgi:L-galactose dehydrogenase
VLRVSILGFGGSPLGNVFGDVDPGEAERAIHAAIDHGINFFDVSPFYGITMAEQRLGTALEGKRQNVVLSTKCGRYGEQSFDFSAARVESSIDESLRRLRTDYVDIFIAHDIEFGDREQVVNETIPAMRKLQEQGKVRWVGISGLPVRMLADVAQRAGVDLVLSYCHYNLLIQDVDTWLTPILESSQAGLINASPLHMGLLTPQGPPAWHPAPESVRNAARQVLDLCRAKNVDPVPLALRFSARHPYIGSTLVGMTTVREVEANVTALEDCDDEDLLAEIETIVAPVRTQTWPSGRPENSDV